MDPDSIGGPKAQGRHPDMTPVWEGGSTYMRCAGSGIFFEASLSERHDEYVLSVLVCIHGAYGARHIGPRHTFMTSPQRALQNHLHPCRDRGRACKSIAGKHLGDVCAASDMHETITHSHMSK